MTRKEANEKQLARLERGEITQEEYYNWYFYYFDDVVNEKPGYKEPTMTFTGNCNEVGKTPTQAAEYVAHTIENL